MTEPTSSTLHRADALGAFNVADKESWPKETVIVLVAFAILWHFASMVLPPFVAPSWARIGQSLAHIATQPEFIAITIGRVAFALIVSFVIGLAVAIAMYRIDAVERYTAPVVKMLMAVPVLCWILFAVLWFKEREIRIAFILIVVCAPIFVIDVLDGMHGVSKDLRDMVRSLRPSSRQFFAKLVLPATVPAILTSWKVNLSLAIRVVTMAELVGASGRVTAMEIDPEMAVWAQRTLADRPNVTVICRSGIEPPLPESDIIYVSAGASEPVAAWRNALSASGRLLFPLTPGWRFGALLLVVRTSDPVVYGARFVTRAGFIPCAGAQSEPLAERLHAAFEDSRWADVRTLRIGSPPDKTCWLAGDGWWLSTQSR